MSFFLKNFRNDFVSPQPAFEVEKTLKTFDEVAKKFAMILCPQVHVKLLYKTYYS
jgi:hypothetical protein